MFLDKYCNSTLLLNKFHDFLFSLQAKIISEIVLCGDAKIVVEPLLDFSVKESGIFTQGLVTQSFLKRTMQNKALLFEGLWAYVYE